MNTEAVLPTIKAAASDPGAAIKRLLEEPPPNFWTPIAVGVFLLLAGTVIVTNTGEPFSLD